MSIFSVMILFLTVFGSQVYGMIEEEEKESGAGRAMQRFFDEKTSKKFERMEEILEQASDEKPFAPCWSEQEYGNKNIL